MAPGGIVHPGMNVQHNMHNTDGHILACVCTIGVKFSVLIQEGLR